MVFRQVDALMKILNNVMIAMVTLVTMHPLVAVVPHALALYAVKHHPIKRLLTISTGKLRNVWVNSMQCTRSTVPLSKISVTIFSGVASNIPVPENVTEQEHTGKVDQGKNLTR